jgi:L-iditol 2-dehydrogenase
MRVAVYHHNKDVRIEDRPRPDPNPGEILVETKACGVCVADTMEWYLLPRAPLVLGHEPTGVIAALGSGVEGFEIGDRVAVHHHVPCLICNHCRRGNFTMCPTFKSTHIHPGGFADYFTASAIHVKRDVLKLPDAMSFQVGTLVEPLACVIHAIHQADIKAGDKVVLIGTGSMGLMYIQALKYWGVRDLIVYELLEWRKQKAIEFGAPHVFEPGNDQIVELEKVKETFGGEAADKVIIAAKDLSAMSLGLSLVEKGGTILFFATPHPDETLEIHPSEIFFNELTIKSSYSADHNDTRVALDLLSRGDVDGNRIITNIYPLEQLSDAIQQTASRDESLKCVISFE